MLNYSVAELRITKRLKIMKKKGRIMQVLASFLFLFVLLTCHTNLKAQGKAVNMNYKEVSFVEAINSFRQQTGVKFLYNLEKV